MVIRSGMAIKVCSCFTLSILPSQPERVPLLKLSIPYPIKERWAFTAPLSILPETYLATVFPVARFFSCSLEFHTKSRVSCKVHMLLYL